MRMFKNLVFLFVIWGLLMTNTALCEINPEVFHADNGLEVWLVQRNVLPFVVFKFVFPAGSVFEPADKAGLAYITSQMLMEGTKNLTNVQISEELEFLGSDVDVDCGRDFATLTLKTLKRNLDKSFSIVAQIIKESVFDKNNFERVRNEIMGEILKDEEDPGFVAAKKFNEVIYGKDHPYGRPVKGYVDTVKIISRDEAYEFYKEHYLPEGSILVVVGDIDKNELVKILNKYLSDWVGRTPKYPVFKKPDYKPGEVVVEKDVTQANIVMGHVGVSRSNPDFIPLYVANQVLGGGGLTSKLFLRIREKGGYSYAVYSYFEPALYEGAFKIVLQTKNERADKAISEVIDEVEKYIEQGPTPEELEDAKRYLTGSFPLKIDTNAEIASYLAFAAFYGLGKDYLNKFPELVNKVTLEQVKSVIRKYIHPEKFTIVVVEKR